MEDTYMNTKNYTITTITAKNNIAVAMFANKKYITKTATNNKIALLETFKTILNKVLPNDQLMEKPVLIITTQSILKGFTTDSFIEYLRTGKDANGNAFTDEEFALIKECAELYVTRKYNVRLIDEKMISPKDKEAQAIRKDAFDIFQELEIQALKKELNRKTNANNTAIANKTYTLQDAKALMSHKASLKAQQPVAVEDPDDLLE
jgi:hypothetical protein